MRIAPLFARPAAQMVALETRRHALSGRDKSPLSGAIDLIRERWAKRAAGQAVTPALPA